MINHARTLLINAAAPVLEAPGHEFIPPDFVPVSLPGSLVSIHQVLFGAQPDWAMRNYRARQILSPMHLDPEWNLELLALDSRITYDWSRDKGFFGPDGEIFFFSARWESTTTTPLYLGGTFGVPDGRGQLFHQWRLEDMTGGQVRVTHLKPLESQIVATTLTNNLTDPIPLLGSDLTVRLGPTAGIKVLIEGYARPSWDNALLRKTLETFGQGALDRLFLPPAENRDLFDKVQYFKSVWKEEREEPRRFGALILALIYHTELLRER